MKTASRTFKLVFDGAMYGAETHAAAAERLRVMMPAQTIDWLPVLRGLAVHELDELALLDAIRIKRNAEAAGARVRIVGMTRCLQCGLRQPQADDCRRCFAALHAEDAVVRLARRRGWAVAWPDSSVRIAPVVVLLVFVLVWRLEADLALRYLLLLGACWLALSGLGVLVRQSLRTPNGGLSAGVEALPLAALGALWAGTANRRQVWALRVAVAAVLIGGAIAHGHLQASHQREAQARDLPGPALITEQQQFDELIRVLEELQSRERGQTYRFGSIARYQKLIEPYVRQMRAELDQTLTADCGRTTDLQAELVFERLKSRKEALEAAERAAGPEIWGGHYMQLEGYPGALSKQTFVQARRYACDGPVRRKSWYEVDAERKAQRAQDARYESELAKARDEERRRERIRQLQAQRNSRSRGDVRYGNPECQGSPLRSGSGVLEAPICDP